MSRAELSKPETKISTPSHKGLLSWEDAPTFLKSSSNVVKTGYRPQMDLQKCFASLFYTHNQWGNIWVFILQIPLSALACILLIMFGGLDSPLDYTPFLLMLGTCLVHTPVSIIYHLCISPSVKLSLNRADYALIFVMTFMISYALGYYPFKCNQTFQIVQLSLTGMLAAFNVVFALTPAYKGASRTRVLRTLLTGGVITLAILPVFYSAVTNGLKAPHYPAVWGLSSCFSYVIGGLTWTLHFPEAFFPHRFDCHMNSHAWMHVFIVVSHMLFYMFIYRGFQQFKVFYC